VATTNDLKNGIALNLDGQLWTVVEFQHVKPGKGGAFVRTKLKNILSGKVEIDLAAFDIEPDEGAADPTSLTPAASSTTGGGISASSPRSSTSARGRSGSSSGTSSKS